MNKSYEFGEALGWPSLVITQTESERTCAVGTAQAKYCHEFGEAMRAAPQIEDTNLNLFQYFHKN